ncbi:MAG: 4-hydroxy-tetrahydrodipicolinate synthase [Vampirovibrio sp.]
MNHATPAFIPKVITACITPFSQEGASIDAERFTTLAQYLIQKGSDGLLVHGTTGEGPCLSLNEKKQLLILARQVATQAHQPVHIMAGIGGNNTQEVCEQVHALVATDSKPDSLLVVVPYYNKPTQAGMQAHFEAVAQVAQGVPLVIYNIPNRTGVTMQATTMKQLHESLGSQLLGVKQSDSNIEALSDITNLLPYAKTGFVVWSGDDSLTLPMLALGAKGVISVASHLVGASLQQMIQAFEAGKINKALTLHQQMLPIMRGLFEVTNPILVKACMAQQGFTYPSMRLPMLMTDEDQKTAQQLLQKMQRLSI